MFDIENILIEIWGYPLSYAEFIATMAGFLCVYLASRENILTWPVGIVGEVFLFIIFFQVQLYANMFLQVIFFATTMYGWYKWRQVSEQKEEIGRIQKKGSIIILCIMLVSAVLIGYIISNIHIYMPFYFKEASAYPYVDSLVMVLSVIASVLLAKKKIENWILWIINDIICFVLYYKQGVHFLAVQYLIFTGMAFYGFYSWQKIRQNG